MNSPIADWILRRCQLASFHDLERWQQRTWAKQLEHARKSEFYRHRQLPFTTAADLRQEPQRFLCIAPKEVARITTLPTSGTSGTPKRIFFSEEDLALTEEYFAVGMQELMGPGQRAVIFMPGATPGSVGDLLIKAIASFGGTAAAYGFIRDPEVAVTQAEGADCLLGHPIQLLVLSRFAPHLRPKSILLTGDPVPTWLLLELERTWGCRTHPHYGLTESGFGCAVRGADGHGLQICHPLILLEIIDPLTGALVPDGETGEIVLSTLQRTAMPLLRYRTGDWGRFLPDTLPKRLDPAISRMQEPVYAQSFTVQQLDEWVMSNRAIRNYRATLSRQGLTLFIDSEESSAALSEALRQSGRLSIPWTIQKESLLCETGKRKVSIE